MRVAVINFSGNVGKSTIARHMLSPRLGNIELFSFETVNSSEGGEQFKINQFDELQGRLLTSDVAVIDIGASNIEGFIKAMEKYRASHEDFDYFVVPTVKDPKQQLDTIGTIDALAALGIPKQKVRVVFNMTELDDVVADDFAPIFAYAEAEKKFVLKNGVSIYRNDVFKMAKELGKTVEEIFNDPTDYKAKLKEAKDQGEKEQAVQMILAKRLSVSAHENLDAVYKALFK